MPVYEYICDNCGHHFEQWQSYQDEPLQACPNCAKPAVRKLFSAAGIIFKGSGWYVNDSRKADASAVSNMSDGSIKPNSESKTDSKTSAPGESKSVGKTESKPSVPSESKSGSKAEPKPSAPRETKSGDT